MNNLSLDNLEYIIFFLDLDKSLILSKINKKFYNNRNIILNNIIKKETNINNYENLKNIIININKYNIFLDKLLNNNYIVVNNYLNLSNNNKEISYIFKNYYKIISNSNKIKSIKNKLLLKNYIYPVFEKSLKYILTHYNCNHFIYFDILKYKQKNNQLEMFINYNNTYKNYQKFYLLYLFLHFNKFF